MSCWLVIVETDGKNNAQNALLLFGIIFSVLNKIALKNHMQIETFCFMFQRDELMRNVNDYHIFVWVQSHYSHMNPNQMQPNNKYISI